MDMIIDLAVNIGTSAVGTVRDVLPIAAILIGFQVLVVRKMPPNPQRMAMGFLYVIVGLTLFLVGLEQALFPMGETMAAQLTAPEFIQPASATEVEWRDYMWVYVFAFLIGFSTTIAEPSLIAVALKAEEISGGALNAVGLRLAVALGVAVGVSLGSYRIVTGTPLPYYIMAGYVVVIFLTLRASKMIIPLAYDSGGVTTSTVTVPVVAAWDLGWHQRSPAAVRLLTASG